METKNFFELVTENASSIDISKIKKISDKFTTDENLSSDEMIDLGIFVMYFISYKYVTNAEPTKELLKEEYDLIVEKANQIKLNPQEVIETIEDLFAKIIQNKGTEKIQRAFEQLENEYETKEIIEDKNLVISDLLKESMFSVNQLFNVDIFLSKDNKYTAENLIKIFNLLHEKGRQNISTLKKFNIFNTDEFYVKAYEEAIKIYNVCKNQLILIEYINSIIDKFYVHIIFGLKKLIYSDVEIESLSIDKINAINEDKETETETPEGENSSKKELNTPEDLINSVYEDEDSNIEEFITNLLAEGNQEYLQKYLQMLNEHYKNDNKFTQEQKDKYVNDINESIKKYGEIYKKNIEYTLRPIDKETLKSLKQYLFELLEGTYIENKNLKEHLLMLEIDDNLIESWNHFFDVFYYTENHFVTGDKYKIYKKIYNLVDENFTEISYDEALTKCIDSEYKIDILSKIKKFIVR